MDENVDQPDTLHLAKALFKRGEAYVIGAVRTGTQGPCKILGLFEEEHLAERYAHYVAEDPLVSSQLGGHDIVLRRYTTSTRPAV